MELVVQPEIRLYLKCACCKQPFGADGEDWQVKDHKRRTGRLLAPEDSLATCPVCLQSPPDARNRHYRARASRVLRRRSLQQRGEITMGKYETMDGPPVSSVRAVKDDLFMAMGVYDHLEMFDRTQAVLCVEPHVSLKALWDKLNKMGAQRGMFAADRGDIDAAAGVTQEELDEITAEIHRIVLMGDGP